MVRFLCNLQRRLFVKRKKRNIEQISTYVTNPGCNDLTNVEQIVAEVEALYWY